MKRGHILIKLVCLAASLGLVALLAAGCTRGEALQDPTVKLFFADPEPINSGKPGPYGFVTPVNRVLPGGSEPLRAALEELIRGPLPQDGDVYRTVPPTVKIVNIEIHKKTAVIELSPEALTDSPGGTLGGAIFIQSMVHTAVQFPEIDKIQVLVNGDPWCDGHYIWEEPLGAGDLGQ
jgi:hypothetical protein